jgi:hypothetical protein
MEQQTAATSAAVTTATACYIEANLPLAALERCTSFSSHQKLGIDWENASV